MNIVRRTKDVVRVCVCVCVQEAARTGKWEGFEVNHRLDHTLGLPINTVGVDRKPQGHEYR